MTWDDVLLETAGTAAALPAAVERLFMHAAQHWPLWRDGHAALQSLELRTHGVGGERVIVQYNPARRRSVHAAVDPAAIAARPCFLCPSGFPPGECGVGWRDLALLPNPYPIVERHLTIPAREHRPQALAGRARELVELARALDPAMCTLYNGPQSGASAPDHFHFQAGLAAMPAFDLVTEQSQRMQAITSWGRRFIALVDDDVASLGERIESALAAWGRVQRAQDAEPLCNVLVRWYDGRGVALFFPRRAHRPRAFYATGEARIAVSPAAIEMGGILVVPDPESLERLDARAVREVFEDVSPTADQFAVFLENTR